MKLGRHMSARAVGTAPRETYAIVGTRGDMLGVVEWYRPWKQHAFDPEVGAVFSSDCLRELAAFCERLSREDKGAR